MQYFAFSISQILQFNPIYPKEFLLDLLWNPKGREVTLISYDFHKNIQTLI